MAKQHAYDEFQIEMLPGELNSDLQTVTRDHVNGFLYTSTPSQRAFSCKGGIQGHRETHILKFTRYSEPENRSQSFEGGKHV